MKAYSFLDRYKEHFVVLPILRDIDSNDVMLCLLRFWLYVGHNLYNKLSYLLVECYFFRTRYLNYKNNIKIVFGIEI